MIYYVVRVRFYIGNCGALFDMFYDYFTSIQAFCEIERLLVICQNYKAAFKSNFLNKCMKGEQNNFLVLI